MRQLSISKRVIYSFFILVFFAGGCSSDFSPNGEWKETMLVYGLLDTEADTTWIRVQKCFLGEGNLLQYAKIKDSSIYAENDLVVMLKEYNQANGTKGSFTGKEFILRRGTIAGKNPGDFFEESQPVYYADTKGQIQSNKMYSLEIQNNVSGLEVYAETVPVNENIVIKHNSAYNRGFSFEKQTGGNYYTDIRWVTHASASLYQPVVRFYYIEKATGLKKHSDYKGSKKSIGRPGGELSYLFEEKSFGSFIKNELSPYSKGSLTFVDSITIFIMAADEIFSDYMILNQTIQGVLQEKPIFTNISGGIGVFGSRSTHKGVSYPYGGKAIAFINTLGDWFN